MAQDKPDSAAAAAELKHWPAHTNLTIQFLRFFRVYGWDHVLLIRVGSFYELYGSQAKKWSPILGLKQTAKGNIGFPQTAFHSYVSKLVCTHNQRVVIIEQLSGSENAIQRITAVPFTNEVNRSARGLVRYVHRLYTPGTYVASEDLPVILCALYLPSLKYPLPRPSDKRRSRGEPSPLPPDTPVHMTVCEQSSRQINYIDTTLSNLAHTLRVLRPNELLIPRYLSDLQVKMAPNEPTERLSAFLPVPCITERPSEDFVPLLHPCDPTPPTSTGPVPECNPSSLHTRHALFEYLDYTHLGAPLPELVVSSTPLKSRHAFIPEFTATDFELFHTLHFGDSGGSLFGFLDQTITDPGSAALKQALLLPFTDLRDIDTRATAVGKLKEDDGGRYVMRLWLERIKKLPHVGDIVKKIMEEKATTRSLYNLAKLLNIFAHFRKQLEAIPAIHPYTYNLPDFSDVSKLLDFHFDFTNINRRPHIALDPEKITSYRNGICLRPGIDPFYDKYIEAERKFAIRAWEVQYAFCREFGLSMGGDYAPKFYSAKVLMPGKTKLDLKGIKTCAPIVLLPDIWQLIPARSKEQRLTLIGVPMSHKVRVRYQAWDDVQDHLFKFRTFFRDREARAVKKVSAVIARDHATGLQQLAKLSTESDILQSLSFAANRFPCVRTNTVPSFSSRHLVVRNGFHPLLYTRSQSPIVSTDFDLDSHTTMCIISGPNTSGKTTAMKTVGINAFLQQIGTYIATSADSRIPIYDAIFARLGSLDDTARDESTFFNELAELGQILRHATPESLVMIDELGRGTTYKDGLAFTCATVKELLDRRCTTIMTTHLHGLSAYLKLVLPSKDYERIVFKQMSAAAQVGCGLEPGKTSFDYQLKPGATRSSMGLEFAAQFLPPRVMADAYGIRADMKREFEEWVKGK